MLRNFSAFKKKRYLYEDRDINHKEMKSTIILLGLSNSARSQMAEGFIRNLVQEPIKVISAGSILAPEVHPKAIEVMREKGIDISDQSPKFFKAEMSFGDTTIISMGVDVQENFTVPMVWSEIENWNLDDPSGADITFFRSIRDRIFYLVKKLLESQKINFRREDE
jgi:arsenate reductase (thioredoxin)